MYGVSLPVPIGASEANRGKWQALIGMTGKRTTGAVTHGFGASAGGSARYSLSVYAFSNLRMRASLSQSHNEPGATIFLRAALTEYAIPLRSFATVQAEVTWPDETQHDVTFARVGPGVYETSFVASQPGVYRCRILARGRTLRGDRFTREQTLTGAVWRGGNNPRPHAGGGGRPNNPG